MSSSLDNLLAEIAATDAAVAAARAIQGPELSLPISRRSESQRARRRREREHRGTLVEQDAGGPLKRKRVATASEPDDDLPNETTDRNHAMHEGTDEETAPTRNATPGPSTICSTARRSQGQRGPAYTDEHGRHIPAVYHSIALEMPADLEPHSLGTRAAVCKFCGALHWPDERKYGTSWTSGVFTSCCASGKVRLAEIFDAPDVLERFLTATTTYARTFRDNIRAYNNLFSFTSLFSKQQHEYALEGGIYSFKIQGALHHRIGALAPSDGHPSKFAQIYFYESSPEAMLNCRMGKFESGINADVTAKLQNMLCEVNPFVKSFCSARERMDQEMAHNRHATLRIMGPEHSNVADPRVYSRPTSDEVAAIIIGGSNASSMAADRHITLKYRDDKVKTVSCLHPAYLALRYPLLLPYGQLAWHRDVPMHRGAVDDPLVAMSFPTTGRRVSQTQFYSFYMHDRHSFSTLFCSGRLFQEFIVDAWTQVEASRLQWYKTNQNTVLRLSSRSAIRNAMQEGTDAGDIGQKLVLPGTFTGGPRYWTNLYHDAMAIVRAKGRPDLFITFTSNPNWPEIKDALLPGQEAQHRPDLVSRVFQQKLKLLQDMLIKDEVFGSAVALVRTTEFQKRGLPHAHLLLILKKGRILTDEEDAARIDRMVSAELPDPDTHPRLFDTVVAHMVHGPCSDDQPCMNRSKFKCLAPGMCGKRYPRAFQETTSISRDGYPLYRRRDDGRVAYRRTDRHKRFPITNQNIVPYNPYLSSVLGAHVNVEVATNITAVKYLYKYVYKGPDRVTVTLSEDGITGRPEDEISSYLDGRYVSASEACTRLLRYDLHHRQPGVIKLPVHNEGEDSVVFDPEDLDNILAETEEDGKPSMLTGYFKACEKDPDATANLTYAQFPEHYTWKQAEREWRPRGSKDSIGRITYVQPFSGERYFLRMLLHTVPGAKSFKDLRTVHGKPHSTYQEACLAMGLLRDDKEWDYCLTEAGAVSTARKVRTLFAIIVGNNVVSDIPGLFRRHHKALSDDCGYRLAQVGIEDASEARKDSLCRTFLQELFEEMPGQHTLEKLGLAPPDPRFKDDITTIHHIESGQNPNIRQQRVDDWQRAYANFNVEQRQIFNDIVAAYEHRAGSVHFIDGPGGTGKTFLENAILAKARASGFTAIAVASSGIASLLLDEGRTAHSFFGIPITDLDENTTCSISKDTNLGRQIRRARLLIWDEAPMAHRFAIEAVERTLQDVRDDPALFGGLTVVFSGDWRQTLPVVPKAGPGQIVAACLHHSYIWSAVTMHRLVQNMRLREHFDVEDPERQEQADFGKWLIRVGDGTEPAVEGRITIPAANLVAPSTLDELSKRVYAGLHSLALAADTVRMDYFEKRMILFARNAQVNECNAAFLERFPGRERVLLSSDEAMGMDGFPDQSVPVEYLQTLDPPGLPPHDLRLKVGSPVLLLRNLKPSSGLCNGTRLMVTGISHNLLQAKIMNGAATFRHALVLLPRVTLPTKVGLYPFVLTRRQFPVRPAFAMTINKSQGQSLHTVGLDLSSSVFSHGQLYVALSRATSIERLHVRLAEGDATTDNVVYPNALK